MDDNQKTFTWEEVEEFARKAFYRGREFEVGKYPKSNYRFKRQTFNEYLREIERHGLNP